MANFQFTDEENRLSSRERSMIKQARENDLRHQIARDAHERRMERRSWFLGAGGGTVSPQERAEIEAFRFNQGLTGRERALQAFERGMQGDRIAGDVKVAEAKRDGMIGQGRDAANANGQWGLKIEQERGKNALSLEEKKWAGQRGLEETRGKNALDVVTQQGKDSLLTEKERQGGALNVETQRGKSAAEINKATLESQERINKATLAAQQGRKGAMTPEQESAAARDLIKQTSRNGMPTMSYEDALKQIRGGGQQGGEAWPGYSAEATAELKRRGYILVNGKPVKNS